MRAGLRLLCGVCFTTSNKNGLEQNLVKKKLSVLVQDPCASGLITRDVDGESILPRYSHPCKPRSHIAFAKTQGIWH